jgi:hypothetical protein
MTDTDGLIRITAILGELALFDLVQLSPRRPLGATAGAGSVCWVRPWKWSEDQAHSDDVPDRVRRVEFRLMMSIGQGGDDYDQLSRADEYSGLVCAAIVGQSLGDRCVPRLTRVESGAYSDQFPDYDLVLSGSFSYLPGDLGEDPTD